jgi:hypothetical protein
LCVSHRSSRYPDAIKNKLATAQGRIAKLAQERAQLDREIVHQRQLVFLFQHGLNMKAIQERAKLQKKQQLAQLKDVEERLVLEMKQKMREYKAGVRSGTMIMNATFNPATFAQHVLTQGMSCANIQNLFLLLLILLGAIFVSQDTGSSYCKRCILDKTYICECRRLLLKAGKKRHEQTKVHRTIVEENTNLKNNMDLVYI